MMSRTGLFAILAVVLLILVHSVSAELYTLSAIAPPVTGGSLPELAATSSLGTCTVPAVGASGPCNAAGTICAEGTYRACDSTTSTPNVYSTFKVYGDGGIDYLSIMVPSSSSASGCIWQVVGTAPNFYTLSVTNAGATGCTTPTLTITSSAALNSAEVSGTTASAETITVVLSQFQSTASSPSITCDGPTGNPVVGVTPFGATGCQETTSAGTDYSYDFVTGSTPAFTVFTVSGGTVGTFNVREETTINGDPQFVGLRGQSYQVHGIDGAVYNLISDSTMQVNARFAFLRQGKCPTLAQTGGIESPLSNCFSHPGSYIGEISVQLIQGSEVTTVILVSGPAASGFRQVTVDQEVVRTGQELERGALYLNRTGSHTVLVKTPLFNFRFDSSDLFINQRLQVNVPLSVLKSHGLIGQTSRRVSNPGSLKHIQGEVDDYAILSEDLLGNDFVFNQFNPTNSQ